MPCGRQLRIFTRSGDPRELCALARVNMSGSREPSRSSDGDIPRAVVTSPPTGGSEFMSMACRASLR